MRQRQQLHGLKRSLFPYPFKVESLLLSMSIVLLDTCPLQPGGGGRVRCRADAQAVVFHSCCGTGLE